MLNEMKSIFFDLDDTLISFDGVSDKAWEESCEEIITENKLIIDKQKILEELAKQRRVYWDDPYKSQLGRKNIEEARYTSASTDRYKSNMV